MNKVISEDVKSDEQEELKEITLKDTKHGKLSMNNYMAYYTLKIRKSREGIISCLKKIQIEREELSKLEKRESEIKKELKELHVYVSNAGKHNKMLDMVLNKEKDRSQIFDAQMIILRRNKHKMLKLQETVREEMNFMNCSTDKMKDRKNESLKKYDKVVVNKHKLNDDNEKLKKEIICLQDHLQNYPNYKVIKNQIQSLATNRKQYNPNSKYL